MSEQKLKPCPFCGGKAYFDNEAGTARHNAVEFTFKIRCKKCRASLNDAYGRVELWMSDVGEIMYGTDIRDKAIAAWNRRSTDEQADR